MKFGEALEALRAGKRITRRYWTGVKGKRGERWLILVPGSKFKIQREPWLTAIGEGKEMVYHDHIDSVVTGSGKYPHASQWTPLHSDLMAEDWEVIE